MELKIKTEYIELKNALKLLNIISTGGEAKIFIIDNDIKVNGVDEKRRGRKLYSGDTLTVNGKAFLIK